jgi:peptide-methionine (S)-S-oxide reductase
MSQIATFGGGCFWCTEAVFEQLRGVETVVSGYAGGHVPNPSYEQVCGKGTGHAEVVQITFDPAVISYRTLLEVFFATHDPTTPNRQGNDAGPQYRSAIFTHSDEQKAVATEVVAELTRDKVFPSPIVTEVTAFTNFYPAEDYHQGYFRDNPGQPYCAFVVAPKAAKTRAKYASLLK